MSDSGSAPHETPADTETASSETPFDMEAVKSLNKPGAAELSAVETMGLKTIRHTLTGMASDEATAKLLDKISPLTSSKSIETDESYIDFLKISKSLKPEELEKFEVAFQEFNRVRQEAIETKGFEGAKQKWKHTYEQMRQRGDMTFKPLEALLWQWNRELQPLIEEELARVRETVKCSTKTDMRKQAKKAHKVSTDDASEENVDISIGDRFEYGPYLLLVKPEKLGILTMLEILKLTSTGGVLEGMRTARAVLSVGNAVEMEYKTSRASTRERKALSGISAKSLNSKSVSSVQGLVKDSQLNSTQTSWPPTIRAKVGSLLISLLLHVAKVPVYGKDPVTGETVKGEAPAFYHGYQYQGGTRLGVLKVHKYLSKFISGDVKSSVLQPQLLPMLVKPRPWVSYRNGGYLYSSSPIMRVKDAPEQLAYLRAASDRKDIEGVYEGLNVLGETAWTINSELFKTITTVWNSGKEFLEIPEEQGELSIPPAPPRDADPAVRRDWLRDCRRLHNEHQTKFSQRCDTNYKLEIARAFLGERFYLPHNMDFRGRAYPLSPHLNHLGNDLSRSLLRFWEGRRLGESGLRWLKIHTANVFGYDKYSFEEREKFVDLHMEDVVDSAKNPLDGNKWWMQAENPWQTLAACMELSEAMSLPDPTDFVSHLPVHQDGTCNGLQHYAALGGDVEGARQVNLVPSDRPQDVYSKVLTIVQEYVNEDAEKGVKIAVLLKDKLVRKVIKQTVMTNVYGVTFVGARAQIASQLKGKEGIDDASLYPASIYLARKVFQAVRSLFEGAHLIQDWLGETATKISKSVRLDIDAVSDRNGNRPDFMSSVIWTTPLGLPIVQPYREDKKTQIQTKLQSVFLSDPYALRGVNPRKQRTAFPPNYIHSLDATHMLLSAAECGRKGMQFASVHDSYWTHAADVDAMNTTLREAFIRLHEVDLVDHLRNEFVQRYSGMLEYAEIPRQSAPARRIVQVRDELAQVYGVGKLSMEQEISIERERLDLLAADPVEDPEAVERGQSMVTPLSIVEQLPEPDLRALIAEASQSKVASRGVAVKLKSTEHVGTGLDTALEEYEAEAELENEPATTPTTTTSSEDKEPASASKTISLDGKAKKGTLGIFMPLRINPVPPKGNFDVRELADSKYFFS